MKKRLGKYPSREAGNDPREALRQEKELEAFGAHILAPGVAMEPILREAIKTLALDEYLKHNPGD